MGINKDDRIKNPFINTGIKNTFFSVFTSKNFDAYLIVINALFEIENNSAELATKLYSEEAMNEWGKLTDFINSKLSLQPRDVYDIDEELVTDFSEKAGILLRDLEKKGWLETVYENNNVFIIFTREAILTSDYINNIASRENLKSSGFARTINSQLDNFKFDDISYFEQISLNCENWISSLKSISSNIKSQANELLKTRTIKAFNEWEKISTIIQNDIISIQKENSTRGFDSLADKTKTKMNDIIQSLRIYEDSAINSIYVYEEAMARAKALIDARRNTFFQIDREIIDWYISKAKRIHTLVNNLNYYLENVLKELTTWISRFNSAYEYNRRTGVNPLGVLKEIERIYLEDESILDISLMISSYFTSKSIQEPRKKNTLTFEEQIEQNVEYNPEQNEDKIREIQEELEESDVFLLNEFAEKNILKGNNQGDLNDMKDLLEFNRAKLMNLYFNCVDANCIYDIEITNEKIKTENYTITNVIFRRR